MRRLHRAPLSGHRNKSSVGLPPLAHVWGERRKKETRSEASIPACLLLFLLLDSATVAGSWGKAAQKHLKNSHVLSDAERERERAKASLRTKKGEKEGNMRRSTVQEATATNLRSRRK